MAKPTSRRREAVMSTVVALFLIGVVAYFALTAIPSAKRPTLVRPSTAPTVSVGPTAPTG